MLRRGTWRITQLTAVRIELMSSETTEAVSKVPFPVFPIQVGLDIQSSHAEEDSCIEDLWW